MNREERAREMVRDQVICAGDLLPKAHVVGIDVATRLMLAFADQEAPRVPEGMVLVPIDPTEAMIECGKAEMDWHTYSAASVWSAMLSAAPTAPQQAPAPDAEIAALREQLDDLLRDAFCAGSEWQRGNRPGRYEDTIRPYLDRATALAAGRK